MTHLSDLEVKVMTDAVAKHKSGELRCPATALIRGVKSNFYFLSHFSMKFL